MPGDHDASDDRPLLDRFDGLRVADVAREVFADDEASIGADGN
ncbi:hypothetical protein ACFQE8_06135 [Salinirubellus sp. GCM10025818]